MGISLKKTLVVCLIRFIIHAAVQNLFTKLFKLEKRLFDHKG